MSRREFPTEVALSVSSGVVFCDFSKVHECYEFLTGGPVWTHELGMGPFVEMVAADVKRQAPFLAGIDVSGVDRDNWRERLAEIKDHVGLTVTLEPIPDYGRTKGPLETLAEIAGDKPVIVVQP